MLAGDEMSDDDIDMQKWYNSNKHLFHIVEIDGSWSGDMVREKVLEQVALVDKNIVVAIYVMDGGDAEYFKYQALLQELSMRRTFAIFSDRIGFFTEEQRFSRAQIEVDGRPMFLPDLDLDPTALDGPDAIRPTSPEDMRDPMFYWRRNMASIK